MPNVPTIDCLNGRVQKTKLQLLCQHSLSQPRVHPKSVCQLCARLRHAATVYVIPRLRTAELASTIGRAPHSLSWKMCPSNQGSRSLQARSLVRPMHLLAHTFDHNYSYIDFQVSRERVADRYGMRRGSLSGEYFVTHQALAHPLTEHQECLSRLV